MLTQVFHLHLLFSRAGVRLSGLSFQLSYRRFVTKLGRLYF